MPAFHECDHFFESPDLLLGCPLKIKKNSELNPRASIYAICNSWSMIWITTQKSNTDLLSVSKKNKKFEKSSKFELGHPSFDFWFFSAGFIPRKGNFFESWWAPFDATCLGDTFDLGLSPTRPLWLDYLLLHWFISHIVAKIKFESE